MRKFIFIPIILGIVALGFLFTDYQKSNVLVGQGDLLLQQNKPQEALLYYKEAQSTFPFRRDVGDDINSTNLIIDSQKVYGQIVDQEYAEVQIIPGLESIVPAPLKD